MSKSDGYTKWHAHLSFLPPLSSSPPWQKGKSQPPRMQTLQFPLKQRPHQVSLLHPGRSVNLFAGMAEFSVLTSCSGSNKTLTTSKETRQEQVDDSETPVRKKGVHHDDSI